jgi:hypothetical protein
LYKRLGQENWGPDNIVMIYTNLESIPIMAIVKPNTTYTTYGSNTSYTSYTSNISFNSPSAISTQYIIYRLYGDQSVSRYFNLGPFTTLSEAKLAAEKISAAEFGDRYEKEEFSNGLVSYQRLGKDNYEVLLIQRVILLSGT